MADIERLERVYAWAEGEDRKKRAGLPSEWDQEKWICGSVCCVAGKIALEEGAEVGEMSFAGLVTLNGKDVLVDAVAARVLELTSSQGDVLFEGDNDLDDLRFLIDRIAEGVTGWDTLTDALDANRRERSR